MEQNAKDGNANVRARHKIKGKLGICLSDRVAMYCTEVRAATLNIKITTIHTLRKF